MIDKKKKKAPSPKSNHEQMVKIIEIKNGDTTITYQNMGSMSEADRTLLEKRHRELEKG